MTTSTVSRLGRAPEEGIKAPVKATTTTNITRNGNGFAIGSTGYICQTGDRILVAAQTIPGENGIFICGQNDWVRASDMNADNDVVNGQLVLDAASQVLYQISVTSPWTPESTPINFVAYASSMPPSIVLTLSDPIDLVDTNVALITGALDPDANPHIEYDFNTIQSKADATTVADLWLNRLGGVTRTGGDLNVSGDIIVSGTVDGVDVAAHVGDATIHFTEASIDHANIQSIGSNSHAAIDAHIADGSIHFSQASITITASQVSDFDTEVSNNPDVVANSAKVSNIPTALSIGTVTVSTFGITSDGGADDVVLPVFNATDAGLVPGSGGGTTNFLRADGTWAAAGGGGSTIVNLGETDVALANTFDFTGWPADVQGFRISFRDLRHANADMRVRLRTGSVETSGYDSHVTRVASGGGRTFTTSTAGFEIDSGNFDYLLRGYIEGTLMDEGSDIWSITGKIYDEDNDDTIHIYGEIDLGSDLQGLRLQSVGATNFTSGFFAIQYWT